MGLELGFTAMSLSYAGRKTTRLNFGCPELDSGFRIHCAISFVYVLLLLLCFCFIYCFSIICNLVIFALSKLIRFITDNDLLYLITPFTRCIA